MEKIDREECMSSSRRVDHNGAASVTSDRAAGFGAVQERE